MVVMGLTGFSKGRKEYMSQVNCEHENDIVIDQSS
jgi:hypothetical protein